MLCAIAACAQTSSAGSAGDDTIGPGNASIGLRYAEQNCASCHALAAGETWSPVPEATPFDTVANAPGMTRLALNAWLHTSHPSMPNLLVEEAQVDNLAAYLETLKRDR